MKDENVECSTLFMKSKRLEVSKCRIFSDGPSKSSDMAIHESVVRSIEWKPIDLFGIDHDALAIGRFDVRNASQAILVDL